jgi:hypothetical protein
MVGNRIGVFLDYLKEGNEVTVDGYTYVWLDNHVTRETETHKYIIDGLAYKMYPWNNKPDELHYVGAASITLQQLIKLVEKIDYNEFARMYEVLLQGGKR